VNEIAWRVETEAKVEKSPDRVMLLDRQSTEVDESPDKSPDQVCANIPQPSKATHPSGFHSNFIVKFLQK
jgi:hypothetical protein